MIRTAPAARGRSRAACRPAPRWSVRAVRLVHGDVREPVEDLGAAVLRDAAAHELGPLVDERRAEVAGRRTPHLRARPAGTGCSWTRRGCGTPPGRAGARDRLLVVAAAAGELGEHRVEVRADLRAGVDRAAVEADAGAARQAVRGDLAGVGAEVRVRVLRRGDAALQRRAAQLDPVLREPELGEALPRRDAHLRTTRSTSVTSSVTVCSTWMRGSSR